MRRERSRLGFALLLSLLIHTLLLSLTFGGQALGLPGFAFPWRDRRIEVPALQVVLAPPPAAAAEPVVAEVTAEATVATDGKAPVRADGPAGVVPVPTPAPAVIARGQGVDESTLRVPAAPPVPPVPVPAIAAAPSASSPEQLEAARAEALRLELERQEAERLEAARAESARQEAERLEGARRAAAQQEAARQVAAREEAARQDTARTEAARLEAERQETVRQAAARREAAQQEAARQEAARQAVARHEAARIQAAKEELDREAERRDAVRRAMGRQLDAEAAQRDAASGSTRRGRLFGRADPNAELIVYAEAWARKIQLNMTFDMVREAAKRAHVDPVVTVAVRRDGSVESVAFVRSSGVPDIDEAVRRIVQSQVPYQAFPPELAREFDVIEIRRTWHFDMAVRLY